MALFLCIEHCFTIKSKFYTNIYIYLYVSTDDLFVFNSNEY